MDLMTLRRRSVLTLLGLGGAAFMTGKGLSSGSSASISTGKDVGSRFFVPVRVPLPVEADGLSALEQQNFYREISVEDRLAVPEGFRVDLLAAWGDRLGDSRFGFNNDHLGFVQHGSDRASMSVNFEYISTLPWVQGFEEVVGKPLPFASLVNDLASFDGLLDCTALPEDDRLFKAIRAVADQAMTDLGIGVMTLHRDNAGHWFRAEGPRDRRITGISGLEDPSQRLASTGPASAVFKVVSRLGYDDGLGDGIGFIITHLR